jgi:DNA (cytosine-5)-methyltransferase 1
MNFKLGELFCGPGGIAKGAQLADIGSPRWKISHKWASDFSLDTCETYVKNICPNDSASVICKDVHELDIAQLSKIDALAFGAPCNDFSLVGKQKGIKGKYGPLYSYGISVLRIQQPQWFLFENVSGIKSANDGKAFIQIQKEMIKAGYRIYPNLYYFEQYGIPQARHRMIIVGIREDLPYEFKIPSYHGYPIKTCREAIEKPPIAFNAQNNEFTRHPKKVIERLKYIKPGQNAWTADLPKNLKLNVKTARFSQIYKRLDPKKPSYTITGSGGGGTHVYHWSEPRALTNRERARLQTFPDDFIFIGCKESVRKQIGMAVPVNGAKIIFEAILKTFAGIQYDYVEPRWGDYPELENSD